MTSSSQPARIPSSSRSDVIRLIFFLFVVSILASLHLCGVDAELPTENALLLLSATLLAAWLSPSRFVLVAAFVVQTSWFVADLYHGFHPLFSVATYLIRTVLTLMLAWRVLTIRRQFDEAVEAARIDSLTGLPNRRAILEALEAELCRTHRSGRPFSLALLDCDGFKAINDSRGHLVGDRVLRSVATGLRKQTRAYDCIGRLGGDEFVMILSDAPGEGISSIVDRIRSGLSRELNQEFSSLAFSIGVVTIKSAADRESPSPQCDDCLHEADQAMYAAKRSGRNQTRFVTLDTSIHRT